MSENVYPLPPFGYTYHDCLVVVYVSFYIFPIFLKQTYLFLSCQVQSNVCTVTKSSEPSLSIRK